MTDPQTMTSIQDHALDIVENREHLTPDQLSALSGDHDLCREVKDIEDLRAAVCHTTYHVDVEARLKAWHQRHDTAADQPAQSAQSAQSAQPAEPAKSDSPQPRLAVSHMRRLLRVAAVIIGVVVLTFGASQLFDTLGSDSRQLTEAEGTIFTADTVSCDVTLVADGGQQIVVRSQADDHRLTITPDDLEAMLSDDSRAEHYSLSVPYGRTADITLPDGSRVFMHPGARLVFPDKFVGTHRVVTFSGDAYFCVAHDPAHPFIVKTDAIETTVLGTEFNISTTRREVCLVKGKVSLRPLSDATDTDSRPVVLSPHQCATVDGQQVSVATVDVTPYEFWRDGYLYFENATVREIMQEMGRTFNMNVVFLHAGAMDYRMRFITSRTDGPDAAIDAMNSMKKVLVTRRGNTLYIE